MGRQFPEKVKMLWQNDSRNNLKRLSVENEKLSTIAVVADLKRLEGGRVRSPRGAG